jgi:hypothetical protein
MKWSSPSFRGSQDQSACDPGKSPKGGARIVSVVHVEQSASYAKSQDQSACARIVRQRGSRPARREDPSQDQSACARIVRKRRVRVPNFLLSQDQSACARIVRKRRVRVPNFLLSQDQSACDPGKSPKGGARIVGGGSACRRTMAPALALSGVARRSSRVAGPERLRSHCQSGTA